MAHLLSLHAFLSSHAQDTSSKQLKLSKRVSRFNTSISTAKKGLISPSHKNPEAEFGGFSPIELTLRIGAYEINVKLNMPPYAVVDEVVVLRPDADNMDQSDSPEEENALLYPTWKVMIVHKHVLCEIVSVRNHVQASLVSSVAKLMYKHILHNRPYDYSTRYLQTPRQEAAVKSNSFGYDIGANSGKGITRDDLVMQFSSLNLKVPHEVSSHSDDFVRVTFGLQNVIPAGLLKGLCCVQDETAGLVVSVVDPQPAGEDIIDCCADPSGKTLYMASRSMGNGIPANLM
ncbi:hypothetical protein V6N11_020728 [Hibiscus sabdariffa]|uniref:Uncharacterized protein n=1 Tax=Hibiscus sabdariffa TaxID=183260 RepID=A0ABR2Q9A7_9ROSI